jgi:hypothetical protein
MSGIINSAGSKSGVIGTTELDYEEGEWTPGGNMAYAVVVGLPQATYTKIGRLVTVQCHMYMEGNSASTAVTNFTGLPFTATSTTNYNQPLAFSRNSYGGNTTDLNFNVTASATNIYCNVAGNPATKLNMSSAYIYIGGSYITDD